jgi:hypothetical protein
MTAVSALGWVVRTRTTWSSGSSGTGLGDQACAVAAHEGQGRRGRPGARGHASGGGVPAPNPTHVPSLDHAGECSAQASRTSRWRAAMSAMTAANAVAERGAGPRDAQSSALGLRRCAVWAGCAARTGRTCARPRPDRVAPSPDAAGRCRARGHRDPWLLGAPSAECLSGLGRVHVLGPPRPGPAGTLGQVDDRRLVAPQGDQQGSGDEDRGVGADDDADEEHEREVEQHAGPEPDDADRSSTADGQHADDVVLIERTIVWLTARLAASA